MCGILCRCKSQFLLYSSILSSMHSVCSSRRMESFVLWSLKLWPARGLNNFISAASILRLCEAVKVQTGTHANLNLLIEKQKYLICSRTVWFNLQQRFTADHVPQNFTVQKLRKHNPTRSQWPCGLRRRSTAARLLRSWVRIPPKAWMFVL